MEVIPLSETSMAACAKALTFTWISRFAAPETITSDRGPQFTSNLSHQLCEMLNKASTIHLFWEPCAKVCEQCQQLLTF
jgi:hypothetical protein